jgi:hypothetical protein
MWMNIAAFGDHSMAAGGNIWIGQFRRLAYAVQEHQAFMDSVLSGPVAERALLVSAVDTFLAERESGYLLIEAEAGYGKTHFAARLAREHGLPVHFTQLGAADAQTDVAARSLSAQVIATWKLSDLAPGGALPPEAGEPNWLAAVLRSAAERRSRLAADGDQADVPPVVLVVDALDAAAERPAGLPPLGLPQHLPRGVYVIATVRAGGLRWRPSGKLAQHVRLSGSQRENLDDLRVHLTRLAGEEPLASALAHTATDAEEFTDTLVDRSQGVWVYVQYVLESLAENTDDRIAGIPELPAGLDDYYAAVLEQLCEGQEGRDALRLLAALASLAEPADPPTIAALAGIGDAGFVEHQLRHRLRPFCLTVPASTPDALRRFGLLHDSLREFLSQQPAQEDALREQAVALVHTTRRHICDYFLNLWGGLDRGLPALAVQPELAQVHGGYALRALTTHLRAAGREAQIHQLLRCSADGTNLWYAAHDRAGTIGGYLAEVERLRRDATTVAQEWRYRMIESSLTSVSSTCPPAVLGELVTRGVWTADRALSHIERMTDEERQAQAVVRILDNLPDLSEELVARAFSVAADCTDEDHRATALAAVLPRIPDDLLDAAARAVFSVQGQAKATPLMVALALRWPASRLGDLRWHHSRLTRGNDEHCLAAAVALASARGPGQPAHACLAEARRLDNGYERCRLVQALVPYLPPEAFDQVVSVLGMDPKYADDALVLLARTAPPERLAELCEFALDPVRATQATKVALAVELAGRSTPDLLPLVLRLADTAGDSAGDLLAAVAPVLSAAEARVPLSEVTELGGRFTFNRGELRSLAMGALAARLPDGEGREAVAAMVRFLSDVKDSRPHERELVPFWQWLDAETRQRVLSELCRYMSLSAEYAREGSRFLGLIASQLDERDVEATFEMVLRDTAWHPGARLVVADVLAFRLDDEELERARRACMTFPLEEQAFSALAGLGRTERTGQWRDHVAREGLAMAGAVRHERHKARSVAALAPLIGPELADEAAELVMGIGHPDWLGGALEQLAPDLSGPQMLRGMTALDKALSWSDYPLEGKPRFSARMAELDETRGVLLERFTRLAARSSDRSELYWLAQWLPREQADLAWSAATRLEGNDRAAVLAVLAGKLPPERRAAAVDEALTTLDLEHIIREASFSIPTVRLFPDLTRAAVTDRLVLVYREFLTQHMTIRFDQWLECTAPYIPGEVLETALRRATSTGWYDYDAKALTHLAPCLSGPLLERALDHVSNPPHGDRVDCARALAALAPYAPGDSRPAILSQALEFARQHPWNADYDGTYLALIPQLEGEEREEAVTEALEMARFYTYGGKAERGDWPRFTALLSVLRTPELERLYGKVYASPRSETRAVARAHILRAADTEEHRGFFFVDGCLLQQDWPTDLDRPTLFDLIAASAWYLRRHGGQRTVRELTDAVFDVIRWWP